MPVAYNKDTGEGMYLGQDNAWQKAKVAKNPQTGEIRIHDGIDWKPIKDNPKSEKTPSSSDTERFASGLRDPLEGATQTLYNSSPEILRNGVDKLNNYLASQGFPLMDIPKGGMDEVEKKREQKIQSGKGNSSGTDWSRTAGDIVSSLGISALAPELGLGKIGAVPKIATRLAKGIAGGSFGAALQPVANGEFNKEKLNQIRSGAEAGLSGGLINEAVAKSVAPAFKGAVKKLLDEGVDLTPGQLFPKLGKRAEAAIKSVPVIGGSLRMGLKNSVESFNKAVFNRVLRPLGEKLPKTVSAGRQALTHVEDILSQRYEKLLPKLTFRIDAQLMNDLAAIDKRAELLPKETANHIKSLWQHIVEPRIDQNTGNIDGKSLKKVEGELSYQSRVARKSPDPYVREMGKLIDEKRSVMRQALARNNPAHANELSKLDNSYSMFIRARDAAIRRTKAGEEPDLFTPSDLLNTIKSSSPKGSFARGNANLQDLAEAGHMVIPDIVPDSGTTERAIWAALLSGGATINPYLAASGAGLSALYTKPGMSVMGSIARPGPTREAAKKLIQSATPYVGISGGASEEGLSREDQ